MLMLLPEEEKDKEWSKLAITGFAKDWDNEKDAIYDDWKRHYHIANLKPNERKQR
jgi:hypothetical protein